MEIERQYPQETGLTQEKIRKMAVIYDEQVKMASSCIVPDIR